MPETTTETSDLITIPANPVALFTDDKQFGEFYQRIKREVEAFVPDLTSDKGRKEVASMAFRVVKTKTALDAAGKSLTEDARKQIDKVNAARRTIWDQLDTLAKEVRKPLTEWEEREAKRVERCEQIVANLRSQTVISFNETADDVRVRLTAVRNLVVDEADLLDFHTIIVSLKATALEALEAAVIRLTQEEADRAELERLRAEANRRNLFDGIRKHIEDCRRFEIAGETYPYPIIQRELEERVLLDAEAVGDLWPELDKLRIEVLAEVQQVFARQQAQAEREERDRQEREAEVIAEGGRQRVAAAEASARAEALAQAEADAAQARAENEANAAAEMRRLKAEHDAEIAEALRERDNAVREQQRQEDERKRLDATQAAQAEQQRREDEARTQDRAHRSKLMGEAKDALMASLNLSERSAKKIVLSICAGDIPHISMRF